MWVKDGKRHVSAVSYDKASAHDRMVRLEKEGAVDVEMVSVKPGETLHVDHPRTGRSVRRKYTTGK
jgi:hypothetical protein